MKITLKPTDPERLSVDALVAFIWENELSRLPISNGKLLGQIKEEARHEDFSGKADQMLSLSTRGEIAAYKVILIGLGKKDEFDLYKLRKAVAKGLRVAKGIKSVKIALVVEHFWTTKFTTGEAIQAVTEALLLANYRFAKYKSEEKKRDVEEVILSLSAAKLASAEMAVTLGTIVGEATNFARDLVNEPAAITTPTYLAAVATKIAKDSQGAVKAKILERVELEKLGMGAYLGVARGSDEQPKFIHVSYKGEKARKKIVIIGKGITFDTGGLSLKSSEHMETMKIDMAGAAAVLGVFSVLPKVSIEAEVIGLIAACENMPSGKALHPGDILRAMNGKTIEVLNTDAEGRLTLADALSFAVAKEKPDCLIDLATLTGACMVALGQEVAGLFGNNKKLIEEVVKSAAHAGERVWQLPLEAEYRDLIKSDVADLKNIQTGRYGGAITAALFLDEFTGSTPWVHLDIAGPAYAEKETDLVPKGGSGFGVRLLLHLLHE